MDAADILPKYICADCRQKVVDFNEFYCVVRTAQRSYTDRLPKTEAAHDDGDGFDDALDAATLFMEPETVLFETDGNAASDSEEMVDDDAFDDVPRMGNDAETLEFGSEELMESADELAGEEAVDGQTDCEVECEEKSVKLAKLSRATINATIGEHFDLSCDHCSAELKTLKQTVDHYANEHGEDGYMKCCDMRLKLRFQVEDHVRWHLDPNVFA